MPKLVPLWRYRVAKRMRKATKPASTATSPPNPRYTISPPSEIEFIIPRIKEAQNIYNLQTQWCGWPLLESCFLIIRQTCEVRFQIFLKTLFWTKTQYVCSYYWCSWKTFCCCGTIQFLSMLELFSIQLFFRTLTCSKSKADGLGAWYNFLKSYKFWSSVLIN